MCRQYNPIAPRNDVTRDSALAPDMQKDVHIQTEPSTSRFRETVSLCPAGTWGLLLACYSRRNEKTGRIGRSSSSDRLVQGRLKRMLCLQLGSDRHRMGTRYNLSRVSGAS